MPRITTIVPCYQAEKTIRETLSALQAQTFKDWEAIVIDDGSTDSSPAIIQSAAESDPRIKLLTQENAGPSVARNYGLKQAAGEFIHFLDADDLIVAQTYEKLLNGFKENISADLIYCNWRVVSESGQIFARVQPPQEMTFDKLSSDNPLPLHALLSRKSALDEVSGFDENLLTVEDWDLWVRLIRIGKQFHSIPDELVSYRKIPGSLSRKSMFMLRDTMTLLNRLRTDDPNLDFERQLKISETHWRETSGSKISYYLGRAFQQGHSELFEECLKYIREIWTDGKSEPQWNIESMILGMNESELADASTKQLVDHKDSFLLSWEKIQRIDREIKNSQLAKAIASKLFENLEAMNKQNEILNQTLWNRSLHIVKKALGYR